MEKEIKRAEKELWSYARLQGTENSPEWLKVLSWHTQSIKNLLEKEVEREKKIIDKYPYLDETSNRFLIIGKDHFILAKQETISHLQQVIKSLEQRSDNNLGE